MTSWLRLWHDMPTDPKWRVIAKKSGQPISVVIAIYNFLLINASTNANERGRTLNWNNEDVAAALDLEEGDIQSVLDAMEGKVIEEGKLTGWEKRQPKREDSSAERAKLWRERKRTQENAQERPDTETDTEQKVVSNETTPRSRAKPELQKPADVSEGIWKDFTALRKKKRAPLTETALEGIRLEAGKAGWVLQSALAECCARGWQGFKAEWVNQQSRGQAPPKKDPHREKQEISAQVIAEIRGNQ